MRKYYNYVVETLNTLLGEYVILSDFRFNLGIYLMIIASALLYIPNIVYWLFTRKRVMRYSNYMEAMLWNACWLIMTRELN